MNVLLVAINAKYIHSNLAVHSLREYAKEYKKHIKLVSYTINNYFDDILQAIYKEKPEFIGFSCYIWNIAIVEKLCKELRKILPNTKIWLGGPEVSYDAKNRLNESKDIDGIIIGEGEQTFIELLDYYIKQTNQLMDIKGIAYKETARLENHNKEVVSKIDQVQVTSLRPELNLDQIPFAYHDLEEFENRIIYYETSRGCPYSCSYCLSSIDKKVRLRDLELVKKDLLFFIKHKVPQVKFVDRTFNCNHAHAQGIWNFIKEHDNGITNFHFEISADIINEEELQLLSSLRPGLVQLEIGVQSTNLETIDAIKRRMDLNKLSQVVRRINQGRNIHQHLDLIAGLPNENFDSFKSSFNEVYALIPDQLQLGFLKVLKGSGMHRDAIEYGIVYKSEPPYEVLYTNWLSYDEVLALKNVESMVEIYYNSHQFDYTVMYMEHFFETPFDLYNQLGIYYNKRNLFTANHSRIKRYEILIDFMSERSKESNIEAFKSILVHDLYLRENLKTQPPFAKNQEAYIKFYKEFYRNEAEVKKYLQIENDEYDGKQLKQYLHLEHYDIDIEKTAKTGQINKEKQFILYDYLHRNPLDYTARTVVLLER